MDVIDWNMIAAVAQVLGFGGIIWGLAQNRRTLQTQVALEFYRRFADITDKMPVELRLASATGPHWATIQDPLRGQMLVSMLSYLNLSAEEFALYQKGRLPKDVWQVTIREIEDNFAKPLWQSIWQNVKAGYASQPDFAAMIEAIVRRNPAPHAWSQTLARGSVATS